MNVIMISTDSFLSSEALNNRIEGGTYDRHARYGKNWKDNMVGGYGYLFIQTREDMVSEK